MNCPLCDESRQDYLFVRFGLTYLKCPGCGLIRAESAAEASSTFSDSQPLSSEGINETAREEERMESHPASTFLSLLVSNGLPENSRVLAMAEHGQLFLDAGKSMGLSVTCVGGFQDLKTLADNDKYDAVLLISQLQKSLEPGDQLEKIRGLLNPGGWLLVAIPSLDSRAARLFGGAWTEWRPEYRLYFSNTTIQLMMWKNGFDQIELLDDSRAVSMEHINRRAKGLPQTWLTRTVRGLYCVFPGPLRGVRMTLPPSGIAVLARKSSENPSNTCSFIVPAYNEAGTFSELMSLLVEKSLPKGVKKEIIVIESNSTDGTRDAVLEFENHPDIKAIYQDRPRGKGNAVREGLASATGGIIVIQDADLEYDLNDLDELLMPLLDYQAAFVLGSRHGGQWKMRQFAGEKGMSAFFNFGHLLFTGLLNLLYGQRLKDPFTMYKVFRRDCLHGLRLEANRFDFDFELVIKLIRKGYRPLEIPINYRSRSFKEGKKVRVFRDPLTWIWALLKYRFAPIYEKKPR